MHTLQKNTSPLEQKRLTNNKKRIFAIHGGGNIGLGLMADVISQSPLEYEVIATSNDIFLTTLINSKNQFWLHNCTLKTCA